MASCSTIRARETCPVHIAKEHQNLCLFRTWYFGQIFHKQCTSISTSILFRQKYLDGYFSRLLPPLCPLPPSFSRSFLQTFYSFLFGSLSSFLLKNLPPSLSAFSFVIMRFHDDEIEDRERENRIWKLLFRIDESLLVIGRFIDHDSRILISWSLRNLFSHEKWIIIYKEKSMLRCRIFWGYGILT